MATKKQNTPDICSVDKENVWHHLTQHKGFEQSDPMLFEEGDGMRITNVAGQQFLDATSGGLWTVNVGFGRESIAKAVYDQLIKLCYFSNAVGTIPGAVFAERLLEKMPGLRRVYYSNSGSEANEKAYKMVRQIAHKGSAGKKHKIIYRDRDYHGTTIGALSSTGQSERRDQYGPFAPGFAEMPHCCCYRCPFGKTYGECEIECATVLEDVIIEEGADTVGALVLEPITAGGGVIEPPPEYFPIVQEICNKYEVLLHIDEVVCGLGRTGLWFGYQHFDVKPDIVTMAKGIASGYAAISCTVTTEDIFDRFKEDPGDKLDYFRDVSTFGGCAGGPAAALETMEIIESEKLLENVRVVGGYLKDQLLELKERHNIIGDARGRGFLAGLELVADRKSKEPADEALAGEIAAECARQGVLIGRTNRSLPGQNNTLILSPAFIASKDDIDQIVGALDNALSACTP